MIRIFILERTEKSKKVKLNFSFKLAGKKIVPTPRILLEVYDQNGQLKSIIQNITDSWFLCLLFVHIFYYFYFQLILF